MTPDRLRALEVLDALDAVAAELSPEDEDDVAFFSRLSATIGNLAEAAGAGFLRLGGDVLTVQPGSFGFPAGSSRLLPPIPCRRGGEGPAERVVFGGEVIVADDRSAAQASQPYREWFAAIGIRHLVVVRWGTPRRPIGILGAFRDADPAFSDVDAWVLRVAARAAGMVAEQRRLARVLLGASTAEADRMRASAERITQLEEMKRRLLNLAAHELRGPVTVMRGYLSMIADGSLDGPSLRRVVPILLGKAAQMDLLITQMLESARLEESRLELSPEAVDLGRVVREVVDVSSLLAPPGISVALERPPEPLIVHADEGRVATIVANLVDNAIKYSPDGGDVVCSVGGDRDVAWVKVADEGLGIAPGDLESLFTRFGRIVTPENSHIPGTGLGLHLSREIARLHGGDITVQSEPGKGSEFILRLPRTGIAGSAGSAAD